MKKSLFGFACICLLLIGAGFAMAQGTPSAKFAAAWSVNPGIESVVTIPKTAIDSGSPLWINPDYGYTLATIKVPQAKELLVGVSAEIGLVTTTMVGGKNGGSAKSLAGGRAFVNVFALPKDATIVLPAPGGIQAEPGQVMLSSRIQELSATLGGVIQSCEVNCDLVPDDPLTAEDESDVVCEDINIADDCLVTDEQIGLLLDTTAAHHYNFVFPNLPQGTYDIVAVFTTGVRANVNICGLADPGCTDMPYDPDGTAYGSAFAKAIINNTMVTVQEVRAVQKAFPVEVE